MGTRLLCSTEACATRAYKERVVRSTAEDTVYTTLFDLGWPDAPHRVLRNTAFAEWEAAGRPASGQRPGEGTIVGTVSVAGTTMEVPQYGAMPLWRRRRSAADGFCLPAAGVGDTFSHRRTDT